MDEPELFPSDQPHSARRRRWPSRPKDPIAEALRFHPWTLDKLQLLYLYLKQYRRVAGSGTYLDAFAGTGRVIIAGKERPGSAGIAIESGAFRDLFLFELPECAPILEDNLRYRYSRRRARWEVIPGDSNQTIPVLLGSGRVRRDKPCFEFLDPRATELDWQTIVHLAGFKSHEPAATPPQCKVELFILLATEHALRRHWPVDRRKHPVPPNARLLDRVMGGRDAWLDLYEAGLGHGSLTTRYAQRLRDLGYLYVEPIKINDPATGELQYFMFHATDHPAAVDFMQWAKGTPTSELARKAELPLWT
jgi:three-Cys-motif partner protein